MTRIEGNLKERLDCIYDMYNKREYVNPDPLLFLYNYSEKKDREIAGFLAACFAYGRVDQIMKTVGYILGKLVPGPHAYLMTRKKKDMLNEFKGFRYRFAGDAHLVGLLWGLKQVIVRHGSLENCFHEGWTPDDETIFQGLIFLSEQVRKISSIGHHNNIGHLLADPEKKSACKRSHLFLRWMVRQDRVDPGGWDGIPPGRLIVPVDTHMHRTGILLEFTKRKSCDMKTALEITRGFRRLLPEDPVKYDFSLTRFGIRKDLDITCLKNAVCQHGVKGK